MKKALLFISGFIAVYGGSFEYGRGDFKVEFDFFGIGVKKSEKISTYSLTEQHKNILNTPFYYSYNLNWLRSDTFKYASATIETFAPPAISTPAGEYEVKGFDGTVTVGYDIWHSSPRDYFGVGVNIGASFPWVDAFFNSDNNFNLNKDTIDFNTYRIGPGFVFSKSFKNLSLYGSFNYAYQHIKVKSSILNSNLTLNGRFLSWDIGVRFDFLKKDYKLGPIPILPRLYAVAGYRYEKWESEDFSIRLNGFLTRLDFTNFKTKASYPYFGIGYSF